MTTITNIIVLITAIFSFLKVLAELGTQFAKTKKSSGKENRDSDATKTTILSFQQRFFLSTIAIVAQLIFLILVWSFDQKLETGWAITMALGFWIMVLVDFALEENLSKSNIITLVFQTGFAWSLVLLVSLQKVLLVVGKAIPEAH